MTPNAAQVRALAAADDIEGARAALTAALARAAPRGVDRVPWIHLALEIGALQQARDQLAAGLSEAPDDPTLTAEATALETELSALGLDPAPAPGHAPPTDPDLADRARFVHLFAGREGVHARQWFDPQRGRGGYAPVRTPLTPAIVADHLAGKVTVGSYLVRVDDTCTFFVLDLDITKRALEGARRDAAARDALRTTVAGTARTLQGRLAELGLQTLLFDSGYKGRHLWGICQRPVPARLLLHLGRALRRALPMPKALHLEFFPKQATVPEDGLGNLVKLPLGIHRRSGRRSALLDADGQVVDDPWPALRAPPMITHEAVLDALARLRDAASPPDESAGRPTTTAPAPVRVLPRQPQPEADPDFGRLLLACPVLAALAETTRTERRLTHDERTVLRHVVGHLPDGPAVFNGLMHRCPEAPTADLLRRPLRGHPISCARVRSRIPHVTLRVGCHCAFDHSPDLYPTPLLHIREPRRQVP